jgi:hypothetical protein
MSESGVPNWGCVAPLGAGYSLRERRSRFGTRDEDAFAEEAQTPTGRIGAKSARSGDVFPCIELAGFAAAQVVCCLFGRQPFVPLAFTRHAPDTKTVTCG